MNCDSLYDKILWGDIMIFDKISNAADYYDTYADMKLIKEFVDEFNKNDKPDGTYEIDGRRVFAMIQNYKTKAQTPEMMFEAHKKYIDVQYIVRGMERIRWASLDRVSQVREEYSKGNDIAFYEGDAQFDFTLTKGTFLLLTPEDAHLPGLCAEKEISVRKIVFKIQTD